MASTKDYYYNWGVDDMSIFEDIIRCACTTNSTEKTKQNKNRKLTGEAEGERKANAKRENWLKVEKKIVFSELQLDLIF